MKRGPYRPYNTVENRIFMDAFCRQCIHWQKDDQVDARDCVLGIRKSTFFLDIDDPEYPKEWRYEDGVPVCTAYLYASEQAKAELIHQKEQERIREINRKREEHGQLSMFDGLWRD